MPFGIVRQQMRPELKGLRATLLQEWQRPTPGAAEPVIVVAPDELRPRTTHLYVLWEAWAGVGQQERSEIILDAYKEVAGVEAAIGVTLAVGLTRQEAERMRLDFVPA